MFKETTFQDTPIGKIPDQWKAVKLGHLVTMKYGYRCSIPRTSISENGIKIVSTADITRDGNLMLSKIRRINIPSSIVEDYQIETGDLLFNWRNAQIHVGKTALLNSQPVEKMIFASFLLRLRCTELIDNQYLHFLLNYLKDEGMFFKLSRRAVNQANFNAEELKEVIISLPPLSEQKNISMTLATVTSAIQNSECIIAKTERLKKGLMQQLLTQGIEHTEYKQTSIGKIPKGWQISTLKEVSEEFIGGGTPSTSNPEYWNGNIAWMTSAHINGKIVKMGQKYITKKGLENSSTHVIPQDNLLVATRVGIGKIAINEIDIAISQDLTGVKINKEKAIPVFLYWFLMNQGNKLKSLAQGSTIKGILKEDLSRIEIPLPSIIEQQKIDEILSTADMKLAIEKAEKTKLEKIKNGLMNLLLTGKVRIKVD